MTQAASPALLSAQKLSGGYGRLSVLHDVSIDVPRDGLVSVIGRNGAGKSTLLRILSGTQPASAGRIGFDGQDLTRIAPQARVRAGLVHVPEGRQLFGELSIEDNLMLGAYSAREGARERMESMFEMFPILRERRRLQAGTLSGGQQQMLAMARALMGKPRVLMLDEPSMGLAPLVVAQIFKTILHLKRIGTAILLVEQNARLALGVADYAYVLESGSIVAQGPGRELAGDARIQQAYMGR